MGSFSQSSRRSVTAWPDPASQPWAWASATPSGADPVVEPDRHPSRPAAGATAGQRGLLEGGGAQHHPGHAGAEHLLRIVLGADATAELDADPGLAGHTDDLRQHAPLVRDARARPVEVDDVDPARAPPPM